jgi:multidrug efflux pump
MRFTDIFIRRPVLSCVVSLLILLLGLNAMKAVQIRQYPKMDSTIITVTTAYPGADSNLIAGFITTPLETSIASAEGIDYITSSSMEGYSTITCNIKLNFDPQVAFTDIMSKVSAVQNQLPKDALLPVITKTSDDSSALMYISFSSDEMTPQQITDYVSRVVQPQIETVDGVASAQILGAQTYSMRIFLDPDKLAALNITPQEVSAVLRKNNFQTAAGTTKGEYVQINIRADTDLSSQESFQNIILKSANNAIVRLKDVSKVILGSQSYNSIVTFNGKKAVFIGISPTPTANPLTVITDVRKIYPHIKNNFPPSLYSTIVYDATNYIRASIKEVVKTLIEAAVIVIFVILLFLGSIRSVLIPVITIPLSLIGVFSCMLALGYSINLLTLLALVLAIGLVVDDAIVVVENVYRHIEEGKTPYQAALEGAREIGLPIIAMTITLAAVYAPIGFMGGLTGALFKEFAFTLAASVIISGIVALTLSPMMCSKILTPHIGEGRFIKFVDKVFVRIVSVYKKSLQKTLNYRSPIVLLCITVLLSIGFLYSNTPKETAPEEDQGFFIVFSTAPQYASINYLDTFTKEYDKIFKSFPETSDYFTINGFQNQVNMALSGMVLKPWDKRTTSQSKMKQPLQNKLNQIAGLQTYAILPPPLPGSGGGTPIQFVITTTSDFKTLYDLSEKIKNKAKDSGQFIFVNNSLMFNNPQATLKINRAKAADLGLDMSAIGSSLSSALSGGYVNYFNLQGRSYEVIPQLDRRYRLNPEQLNDIYIRAKNGIMVPLSTVATIDKQTLPNQLTHFQQLNSATINGVMMPGKTLGDGLSTLEAIAKNILPKGFSYNYAGQSRQYIQEGQALIFAFVLSIILIFLVLAAQFESFRDPLTILFSVPLSICGALIPLNLGLASINIYTQIGLITLIGLISKHGILIVDFANHLQITKGLSVSEAVLESAAIRLRPILMTTAAMVFGVYPLLIANGAGAVSRFDIGLVISTGMLIGTCFTLYVVPTMYTFFAKDHRATPHKDE